MDLDDIRVSLNKWVSHLIVGIKRVVHVYASRNRGQIWLIRMGPGLRRNERLCNCRQRDSFSPELDVVASFMLSVPKEQEVYKVPPLLRGQHVFKDPSLLSISSSPDVERIKKYGSTSYLRIRQVIKWPPNT